MQADFKPKAIEDHAAAEELARRLDQFVERLARVQGEPLMVACCPNKFNDASSDSFWQAAQVGVEYVERAYCFVAGSEQLSREAASKSKSEGLGAAVGVLDDLKTLMPLTRRCFPDICNEAQFVALIRRLGQNWFCVANGGAGDDADVWTWGRHGFIHVGTTPRIDERVGSARLIAFMNLREDFWKYLTNDARKALAPTATDEAAWRKLSEALSEAADQSRKANSHTILLLAGGSPRWAGDFYGVDYQRSPLAPAIVLDDASFEMANRAQWLLDLDTVADSEACRSLLATGRALQRLEKLAWRNLFSEAFRPIAFDDRLILLVRRQDAFLIWENSVFALVEGRLFFEGFCDYFGVFDETFRNGELVIHPAS